MKYLSKSLEDTDKIANNFLSKISDDKGKQATVVGLFGDLGSGKTTFTQALGRHLGVEEMMTSPTFVIEKIYSLDGKNGFKKMIHIDAYRLASGKELLSLNFNKISQNPDNLILIEWPERVADILPADLVKINFNFVSEFEREIDVI